MTNRFWSKLLNTKKYLQKNRKNICITENHYAIITPNLSQGVDALSVSHFLWYVCLGI